MAIELIQKVNELVQLGEKYVHVYYVCEHRYGHGDRWRCECRYMIHLFICRYFEEAGFIVNKPLYNSN